MTLMGDRVLPSVAGALDGGHHGVPWQLLQILQAQVQLLRQRKMLTKAVLWIRILPSTSKKS
jgi:hypothetical protein